MRIARWVRRLVAARQQTADAGAGAVELRRAFQARYHHFKLLLSANNKALDLMTDIEGALHGGRRYGMPFVRAACTSVSVNVLQIVRHLDRLAPGRYGDLYGAFERIAREIAAPLAWHPRAAGALILPLDEIGREHAGDVGAKIANLGEIRNRLGMPVPPGFAITARAFDRFLEHGGLHDEIDRRIQAADANGLLDVYALSASLQQLVMTSSVPDELAGAILEAHADLERHTHPGVRVAVRSSAIGEDEPGTCFAGEYRSVLNVGRDSLLDAYREVVASRYSPEAMIHRYNQGIPDEQVAMCVGCLAMLDPVAGGVMYSRHPTDAEDDAILISSAWGLTKAVVDGAVQPDTFVVSRAAPHVVTRAEIHDKSVQLACGPEEGVQRVALEGSRRRAASLDEAGAVALAAIALDLERHWGAPQDIEWAIAPDRTIYLLQSRPLQQVVPANPDADLPAVTGDRAAAVLVEGGVTASPGRAAGMVATVTRRGDALSFPRGAVLVTSQPTPYLASLLGRAVAIVSEEGGVTGHLASVARNLGIPALFGVRGALAALRDGAVVTVDAGRRRVFDGRLALPAADATSRPEHSMSRTPVGAALANVASLIVPLNLLDPESPDFKVGGCRTLHDLTRFCHEMAVAEMFRFGREHRFPERSSKQLVSDVPMQLWVLNLDDGFRDEVEGSQVHLSNIASVPMLALWEGMRAFPWEGPPPVDGRGLLAVMFEAATNPALEPGMQGQFADRNYFLIARNYCSLQSRFGFHFSTVEALVSDRAVENYASFQFKGGGATFERRRARVAFIGDLLEARGFHVELRDDALSARVEGLPLDAMRARLRLLGYLVVHTRQLDMVLVDPATAASYRARMDTDVEALLGAGAPPAGSG